MIGSKRLGTSDNEWGFSVKMDKEIKCSNFWIKKLCGRMHYTNYILANFDIIDIDWEKQDESDFIHGGPVL